MKFKDVFIPTFLSFMQAGQCTSPLKMTHVFKVYSVSYQFIGECLLLLHWVQFLQHHAKRLAGKNVPKNDLFCVKWDVKPSINQ